MISNGSQVNICFVDIGQSRQLSDDIVDHQLHEAQSLEVVSPRGKDFIQPFQVLFESSFHMAHGSCNLYDEIKIRRMDEMNERKKEIVVREMGS